MEDIADLFSVPLGLNYNIVIKKHKNFLMIWALEVEQSASESDRPSIALTRT